MVDEPLFRVTEPAPLKQPEILRKFTQGERPRWSRYRPKNRIPCDACIALLHEQRGEGPYARSARWRVAQGKTVLLLCQEHSEGIRR